MLKQPSIFKLLAKRSQKFNSYSSINSNTSSLPLQSNINQTNFTNLNQNSQELKKNQQELPPQQQQQLLFRNNLSNNSNKNESSNKNTNNNNFTNNHQILHQDSEVNSQEKDDSDQKEEQKFLNFDHSTSQTKNSQSNCNDIDKKQNDIIKKDNNFNNENNNQNSINSNNINDQIYKRSSYKSNSEESSNEDKLNLNQKRKFSSIETSNEKQDYLQSKLIQKHLMKQRKFNELQINDFEKFEPEISKKIQIGSFKPIITTQFRHRNSIEIEDFHDSIIDETAISVGKDNIPSETNSKIENENLLFKQKIKNEKKINHNNIIYKQQFTPKSCPIKAQTQNPFDDSNFLSPVFKCQQKPKIELFPKTTGDMLDDDFSLSNKSHNYSNSSEDEQIIIKEDFDLKRSVDNILLKNQAEMLKCTKITSLQSIITLKCYFKHKFQISVQELKQEGWCDRCQIMINKIKKYSESMNGHCLNLIYEPNLVYKCHNNHVWSVSHKNWNKKWCSTCDKIQKEEQKRLFKDKEEKIHQEKMRIQEDLFNEAKRNMQYFQNYGSYENNCSQQQYQQTKNISFQQKVINAFQKIEQDILKVAQQKSNEYILHKQQLKQEVSISSEHIIAVFKMILLPDNVLKQYFGVLNQENLKQEYRKMALTVHPDKNKHPKAAFAFQKLNNIHSEVLENNNCNGLFKNH